MLSSRNKQGLTEREIANCRDIWQFLEENKCCTLDTSEADRPGSRTRFVQSRGIVLLGADVIPATHMVDARSRMSETACLAHELAHAQRWLWYKINRPTIKPDIFLDEAEASIHASFQILSPTDRQDLIEDARVQIAAWQSHTIDSGANYEN
jgi:hypothetical protein